MEILIKNGSICSGDKSNKILKKDILIKDGKIVEIGEQLSSDESELEIIDAADKLVTPGLIDMHVHLREPGYEAKETIATGTRSAAMGGFTSIACMPNTSPALDNRGTIEMVVSRAKAEGVVRTYPIGAVTKGRKGKELVEMGDLIRFGAVAFSDDGSTVMNANLMRGALEYSKAFDVPIICHCEEEDLVANGVMNEGLISYNLGLPGIPNQVEDIIVARDIMLAELTDARVHIAHVSTSGAVELIRQAKARGVKVTAEVAPHHLILTDEAVKGYDTNTKVNPPLRTKGDIEALIEGLQDDTIDCIATDHAPHTKDEKDVEYASAPFGMVGLETAIAIVIKALIEPKHLTWNKIVKKMSVKPAEILNIPGGSLEIGAVADIAIIDSEQEWTVNAEEFESKGKNSPFDGWKVKGKTVATLVNGKIVMREGKIIE